MHGALTRHADVALAEAVGVSGLTGPEVLAGLTRLITVDGTGRRTRRRIMLPGPAEPLRGALQVFVNDRLLLSDTDDDGQVWLSVVHEALLTEWGPLEAATTEIITALRTARVVEQAATEWTSAQRAEHYLWDDKWLTETLVTLRMTGDDNNHNHNPAASPIVALDDQARAFLDATARRASTVRPMRGLQRLRSARVISAGYTFIQNLRGGHYELAADLHPNPRISVAFTELAVTI